MEKEILTLAEAAKLLGVSVQSLRNWGIPFRRFPRSRKVFVLFEDIKKHLKKGA